MHGSDLDLIAADDPWPAQAVDEARQSEHADDGLVATLHGVACVVPTPSW